MTERRAHVMASVMSALSSLQESVGVRIVRTLEKGVDDRCFMLGGTQRKLSGMNPKSATYMTGQLKGLIELCIKAAEPKTDADVAITYDPIGISFAVQSGAARFNRTWQARLGLGSQANLRKEHWTRIKALNKRFAKEEGVEYDTLRPLADLQTSLLEAISRYLDAPASEPAPEVDEEQPATTRIRQLVAASLKKVVRQRLVVRSLEPWREAFAEKGAGSTSRRAHRIAAIYAAAAPVPDVVMSQEAKAFMDELAGIVGSAITVVGGSFKRLGGPAA